MSGANRFLRRSDAHRVARAAGPVLLFDRIVARPRYETLAVRGARLFCFALEASSFALVAYAFLYLAFGLHLTR